MRFSLTRMSLCLVCVLFAACESPSEGLQRQCKEGGGKVCHDRCIAGDCTLYCRASDGRIDYTPIGGCKIGNCPNPCR